MKTVLIQAGHIAPREPGTEGQTGAPGEQAFVKDMRDRVVELLKKDGRFKTISLPGSIPDGIKCDAALFFHVDGAGDKRTRGYSFGYPSYPVNKNLADLIAMEFNKIPNHPPHHKDNYTRGEQYYYGFRQVDTFGPEVLVEHGYASNPQDRNWMLGNKPAIAQAHYSAITRYFGMNPATPKKLPILVHIVDKDDSNHFSRTTVVGGLKRYIEFAKEKKYKSVSFSR